MIDLISINEFKIAFGKEKYNNPFMYFERFAETNQTHLYNSKGEFETIYRIAHA